MLCADHRLGCMCASVNRNRQGAGYPPKTSCSADTWSRGGYQRGIAEPRNRLVCMHQETGVWTVKAIAVQCAVRAGAVVIVVAAVGCHVWLPCLGLRGRRPRSQPDPRFSSRHQAFDMPSTESARAVVAPKMIVRVHALGLRCRAALMQPSSPTVRRACDCRA